MLTLKKENLDEFVLVHLSDDDDEFEHVDIDFSLRFDRSMVNDDLDTSKTHHPMVSNILNNQDDKSMDKNHIEMLLEQNDELKFYKLDKSIDVETETLMAMAKKILRELLKHKDDVKHREANYRMTIGMNLTMNRDVSVFDHLKRNESIRDGFSHQGEDDRRCQDENISLNRSID